MVKVDSGSRRTGCLRPTSIAWAIETLRKVTVILVLVPLINLHYLLD